MIKNIYFKIPKKKRLLRIFFCLFILSIWFIPTKAAEHKIFDLNSECVDTIKITTGGGASNTLTSAQDANLIRQIIQTLNDFEYGEAEQLEDIYFGVYVHLLIKDKDGLERSIQIDSDGAYAPNNPDNIRYISSDPDYFGASWMNLLFPDPFTDMNVWAYPPVKTVYENGLMLGTSEATFSPDAIMTRGMFLTVLGRMADINQADNQDHPFNDVSESHYCYRYISWAIQNGIVKGTTETTFSPDIPVTREQAVVLLGRYAGALGFDFSENQIFKPSFAEIQDRLSDLQNTSKEFQEQYPALYSAYIMQDKDGSDIFDPAGNMTRREAANIFADVCKYV